MIVYCVFDGPRGRVVLVSNVTDQFAADGVVDVGDPGSPEWLSTVRPGLYYENGEPA